MKNYGMFSTKGNQLVSLLVNKILKKPITTSEKDIYELLTSGFNDIENKGHDEVWDTDVREQVISYIENKTNKELSIYF